MAAAAGGPEAGQAQAVAACRASTHQGEQAWVLSVQAMHSLVPAYACIVHAGDSHSVARTNLPPCCGCCGGWGGGCCRGAACGGGALSVSSLKAALVSSVNATGAANSNGPA